NIPSIRPLRIVTIWRWVNVASVVEVVMCPSGRTEGDGAHGCTLHASAGTLGGMKLGLQLGYWGAQPPAGVAELVAAAEESGFDAVFTAEAWGSDAFTPLAWWGRE